MDKKRELLDGEKMIKDTELIENGEVVESQQIIRIPKGSSTESYLKILVKEKEDEKGFETEIEIVGLGPFKIM